MSLSEFEIKRIEKYVGNFVEKRRPAPHRRDHVDLKFRISNQSFEIYELRARFDDPHEMLETPVAKATFVKSSKIWKLYWMRADNKWHGYKPFPESKSIEQILEAIQNDARGCFWG